MILPVFAAFLLSSCTSTVSSIDTTAASLQPQQAASSSAASPASGEIPSAADKNAPTLSMNSTGGVPPEVAAAAAPGEPSAQVVVGGPATASPNEFSVASADTGQSEISAAAVGVKPADPVAATALPVGPQPVIATAELPAGSQKLKAPEPTGQQVQLAKADAKIVPQQQQLTNAAPAQQFVEPAGQSPAKKPRKTLFASMFGDSAQKSPAIQSAPAPLPAQTQLALASPRPKSAALAAVAAEVDTPQLALTNASIQSDAPLSQPNLENGDKCRLIDIEFW